MIVELANNFIGTGEVADFSFRMVANFERSYIYLVEHEGGSHYEAFLKKTTPLCIDFEKRIYSTTDFKEKYPKAKDFGIWAWTSKDLQYLKNKLNENSSSGSLN